MTRHLAKYFRSKWAGVAACLTTMSLLPQQLSSALQCSTAPTAAACPRNDGQDPKPRMPSALNRL